MLRRAAIIALAIFELVWLNVIIPGHTRGAVTMPCACCCETPPQTSCARCEAERGSHHTPTPRDREHCALCFFAAHLSIPPALDHSAPKLLFLHYIGHERANHLVARAVLVPFDGRGPPVAA